MTQQVYVARNAQDALDVLNAVQQLVKARMAFFGTDTSKAPREVLVTVTVDDTVLAQAASVRFRENLNPRSCSGE